MSCSHFRTHFLFPRTSYWMGAGSIFNITGNYFRFNYASSPEDADARALACDWGIVGNDLYTAFEMAKKAEGGKIPDGKQLELLFSEKA